MICDVCPHYCDLSDGQIGKCLVRKRQSGLIAPDSRISLLAVEPIEKRPFFHFLPGTKWLSVGFYGCSFSCHFCQNFSVSQRAEGKSKTLTAEELWKLAGDRQAAGIVFTYNEPTIHFEYLIKVANHIPDPIKRIAVKTNGFANPHVWERLRFVDAFNVDIKGDDEEYRRICDGSLDPVLASIDHLAGMAHHLEISYLVLPRLLKNDEFHRMIRDRLAGLSTGIPVHLLYYYPFHRMQEARYEPADLLPVVDIFREKMEHVYISNCFKSEVVRHRNTVCSSCGDVIIDRTGPAKVIKLRCCGQTSAFLCP